MLNASILVHGVESFNFGTTYLSMRFPHMEHFESSAFSDKVTTCMIQSCDKVFGIFCIVSLPLCLGIPLLKGGS
jgi:hypothetical protein